MNYRDEWLWSACGSFEQIDKILARNPIDQGESRSQGIRLWLRRPIGVLFHNDDNIKLVRMRRIRWIGR